ncbi:MAG TPA: thiamine phosphate synthase [Terriglobales bacterium]|nr:thiamine phosphate synthase [Terriglobales bacterium]
MKVLILYYITDRKQLPGDESARRLRLLELIGQAASSGVDYIQLREKDLSSAELELLARDAMRKIRASGGDTRLLINSNIQAAIASGVDGLHLRANDIRVADARAAFQCAGKSDAIITVSCHTAEEVLKAQSDGADFVVFGPVFEKDGNGADGLTELRTAAAARIPVLALGGVDITNAETCIANGAAGVAGIRIFQSGEITATVKSLRSLHR